MKNTLAAAATASRGRWGGAILAIVAVGVALAARFLLEDLGRFYYLPMLPAVIATALLARRSAVALAIALSIALNLVLVTRESATDAATNAVMFALVAWGVAELCMGLRKLRDRTDLLTHKLAAQDALLSTVLTTVPVVTLEIDGAVRRMNPAAAQLFGVDETTVRGRPFNSLVPAFDTAAVYHPGLACGALESADGHWSGTRVDGATFPLNIQCGRVPGPYGEDLIALCLTDLSRWHAADAQARELHTQLNKVWRLNSLGEMAATLAHELNQPLSAAATYLHASQMDMERAGPLGDSARRTTELAKAQLLRAGKIIRRMRELLSLEVRSLDRERASSMIEDLGPILTMIGAAKGVTVRMNLQGEADHVRAERIQFQQAIVNLVRNAVEAVGDRPEPDVVIIGRPLSETQYAISVEDNGPGIAADQVERMFQPMTTTKSGGMGLGLSVTRTIVESHGGRLVVARSALGGAAFSFNLIREAVGEHT
ncbi:ATP-binding protein [Brevundimonas sp.]|uniref:ATP-binding protein n=1 Tax=Brevundimonas sp. TaxID=1871086 RepID=UPI002EDA79F3